MNEWQSTDDDMKRNGAANEASDFVRDILLSVEKCQQLSPMPVWSDESKPVIPVEAAGMSENVPMSASRAVPELFGRNGTGSGVNPILVHEDDFAGFGLLPQRERKPARPLEIGNQGGLRKTNSYRSQAGSGFSLVAWLGRLVGVGRYR